MKNDFLCPYCKSHLNINNNVVFSAKKDNGEQGLIFLHPELGNYSHEKHESFKVNKGEDVEIFCPLCQADLKVKVDDHNFVRVTMIQEDKKEYNVLFSSIFGEQCTYKVSGEFVESYGKDVKHGINFEMLSFLK